MSLDSDSEFESVDDDRDFSYVPSTEDSESNDNELSLDDSSLSSGAKSTPNDENIQNANPNEIEFASDLSLAPILKMKSNSDVELWKRFGSLMKAGILVKGTSGRYFCSLCFDNKVLKRSVSI